MFSGGFNTSSAFPGTSSGFGAQPLGTTAQPLGAATQPLGAAAPSFGTSTCNFLSSYTGLGGATMGAGPAAGFGTTQPTNLSFGQPAMGGFGATSAAPAFGTQPGGFGSTVPTTSAFGATSSFGQTQPAAGGAFGQTNTLGGVSTGFPQAQTGGAFPAAQTSGAFGSTAPAFGTTQSTSVFGGQQGFGTTTTAQPGFGTTTTAQPGFGTTSGFGGTSSGFGTGLTTGTSFNQPGGAFGGLNQPGTTSIGGFGQQPVGFNQQVVGTGNPPWKVSLLSDTTATGATLTNKYQSINAMDVYSHKSAEELRFEDYSKGVKGKVGGGIGGGSSFATPGFGQAATGIGATGIGSTALGQPGLGSTGWPNTSTSLGAPPLNPVGIGTTSAFTTPAFPAASTAFPAASTAFPAASTAFPAATSTAFPAASSTFPSATTFPTASTQAPAFNLAPPPTTSLFNPAAPLNLGGTSSLSFPSQPAQPAATPFPLSTGIGQTTAAPSLFTVPPLNVAQPQQPTTSLFTPAPTLGQPLSIGAQPLMMGQPSMGTPGAQLLPPAAIAANPYGTFSPGTIVKNSPSKPTPSPLPPSRKNQPKSRVVPRGLKESVSLVSSVLDSSPVVKSHLGDDMFVPRQNVKRLVIEPVLLPEDETHSSNAQFLPSEDTPIETVDELNTDDLVVENNAPVLVSADYVTVPSIEAMKTMTDEELASVSGFTVIREGVGSVKWEGEVDVSGLDIDSLIKIESREVIVYPNEDDKHEVGHGLNKPAIITLEGIWVKDKETGVPVKSGSAAERYKTRVERTTKALGAELVSYDCESGVWVFRVEHFSRYGLGEEEEESEEEEEDEEMDEEEEEEEEEEEIEQEEEEQEEEEQEEEEMVIVEEEEEKEEAIEEVAPLSTYLGIDPTRLHIMNASLFSEDMPETHVHTPAPVKRVLRHDPVAMPSHTTKFEPVSLSESVTASHNGNCVDMGLFLGRSNRCSWGPAQSLARVCGGMSRVCVRQLDSTCTTAVNDAMMNVHFDQCEAGAVKLASGDLLPTFTLPSSAITDTLDRYTDIQQLDGNSVSLWRLARVLWGATSITGDDERVKYAQNLHRCDNVSEWLKGVVSMAAENDLSAAATPIQRIVALLSAGRVGHAATVAADNGDYHLATLIASSGCYNDLAEQIALWRSSGTSEYIDNDRMSLYSLLSGEADAALSVLPSLTADWRRCFALHLWYGDGASLEQGMSRYDAAVASGRAPQPMLDNASLFDAAYHLLHLYLHRDYPLAHLSEPECFGHDTLDFSGPWHMHSVLCDAVGLASASRAVSLYEHYASQLERIGQWHWAVYVMLQCPCPYETRALSVKAVLSRWAGVDNDEYGAEFVVQRLRVPVKWVHSARAVWYRYIGDVTSEGAALIAACEYNEAHSLVMRSVIAPCILDGRWTALHQILTCLENNSLDINGWLEGGDVFLTFLRLEEEMESLQNVDVQSLLNTATSLSSRLTHMFKWIETNDKLDVRACAAEISVRVSGHVVRLHALLHEDDKASMSDVSVMARQLQDMPLPADYLAKHTVAVMREFVRAR